jgi:ubiquitin carboxyl-terminal hydrolase 36/42
MCGLSRDINDASWINKFLEDIFPTHVRGSQEDGHEMLLFLLDAVDRQQQKLRRSQPGKFSSIVEQVFDGKVRSEYTCLTCQKKSICYEPIRGLSIELPRNPEQPPEMTKVARDYFNDERISGYDCRNCKKKTTANKKTRIVTAPRVLIIQLKRFLRFTKITTAVVPSRNINLSSVMHDSQNASYQLVGYIRHLGGTMSSGHYTAAMCGFDGKTVFNFDDETRSITHNFPTKPVHPYILFYSRINQSNNNMSSKSPYATPAKKPNINGGMSLQKNNSSFTVNNKKNDNGMIAKRVPNNYLSTLSNR